MTQFVDNENLSKNTLLEIDVANMTQSHLTGADQSCGQLINQSVNQSVIQSVITQSKYVHILGC